MSEQRKAVLVCGSRDWADFITMAIRLHSLKMRKRDLIIHGGCSGADKQAEQWAADFLLTIPMPADWKRLGKQAGPIRNSIMCDMLLGMRECGWSVSVEAFVLPESRGTWNMVGKAKKASIPVHVTRALENGGKDE